MSPENLSPAGQRQGLSSCLGTCNYCPSSIFQSLLSQSASLCLSPLSAAFVSKKGRSAAPPAQPVGPKTEGLPRPLKPLHLFVTGDKGDFWKLSPQSLHLQTGGCHACPQFLNSPPHGCKINSVVPSSFSPFRQKLFIPSPQALGAPRVETLETFQKFFFN